MDEADTHGLFSHIGPSSGLEEGNAAKKARTSAEACPPLAQLPVQIDWDIVCLV